MLTREAKEQIVESFARTFSESPSLFVVEYKGLRVSDMESLRNRLKDAQAELAVVKNTLLKIAAKGTDAEKIQELFVGPTAIAVCKGDAPPVAKVFAEAAKSLPQLVLKGGVLDGNFLMPEDIIALSKLPPRDVLLAQLLSLFSSPMSNLVGTLRQAQAKLVFVLTSLKEKKEREEREGE